MMIIKAYHNSEEHEILEYGTHSELLPIYESLIKKSDEGDFILIDEFNSEGSCYADFAHVTKGENHGFVIALAGDIVTNLNKD